MEMLFTFYLFHLCLGILTPIIDSILFSVGSATIGVVRLTMVPQREAVHFVVASDSGSGQVVGNVITLHVLDYTSTHSVNITAASAACPGNELRSTMVPITFNITGRVIVDKECSQHF